MAAYLSRYLEWMRVTGYSERTVGNRETYLGYFVAWADERSVTRPQEVTRQILERYQRYLFHYRKRNGEPLSFRSQYTRLVPVRAFFKWLARTRAILYNPASELELPRLEKRLPRHVLTLAEAEEVLRQPDLDTPMGVRDRAILEVFYSTGMRRMEAINLNLYDLDVDRGTIMIRQGKGKKDRMVPIGERAVAWIDRYVSEVRGGLVVEPDGGTIFLTNQGETFTPSRMTQLVRTYVNQAELGKRGACHLFRHTMATLMLEHGADIRFIQQMLGHAELSTTQIYTQVSIRKLKEIHAATHPGAKLYRDPGSESRDPGDEGREGGDGASSP
jgi:integrase/recombinase XerD